MRWFIGLGSALAALALVMPAGGQGLGKKITPVRVIVLLDTNTKGLPAQPTIKQLETTGPAVGKRAVNEVRRKGTRVELKRLEGVYFTQGARVTLADGKAVNCDVLLSVDVGKTKLRDVTSLASVDAVSDRGMGTWYAYTAEVEQKK
jgi:hypothetical protein